MTSPVSFNQSNWPHLTAFDRQVTACSGPFTFAMLQKGKLSREAYFESCSAKEGCDPVTFYQVLGKTPQQVKTDLDQLEAKRAKEAEAVEQRQLIVKNTVDQKLTDAKKQIVIMMGHDALWFDGKNYYTSGINIDPGKKTIDIWGAIAAKLVEHDLTCEILDRKKNGKDPNVPWLEEQLKYLVEKSGGEYKGPDSKCDYSNEIIALVYSLNNKNFGREGGQSATFITFNGKKIAKILANFNMKIKFTPKPMDADWKFTADSLRDLAGELPLITREAIEKGDYNIDCDGNLYDKQGKLLGQFEYSMFTDTFYSVDGKKIGYTMQGCSPFSLIMDLHNEVILSNADEGYDWSDPKDYLLPFHDKNGKNKGNYVFKSKEEIINSGTIKESVLRDALGDRYDDADEIRLVYNSQGQLVGFSGITASGFLYNTDESGNRKFTAEIQLEVKGGYIGDETGKIIEFWRRFEPFGVDCYEKD